MDHRPERKTQNYRTINLLVENTGENLNNLGNGDALLNASL